MKKRKKEVTECGKCLKKVVLSFVKSSEFSLSHESVQGHFERFKSLAKQSILDAYESLWVYFSSKRAKERFCVLLVSNELFSRSVEFRKLFCEDLSKFCDCCLGTDAGNPLPEVEGVGLMLKQHAKDFFSSWHATFVPKTQISSSSDYRKQLDVMYNFLKTKKGFSFDAPNQQQPVEDLKEVQASYAIQEMKEFGDGIQLAMVELENGLNALFPSFEEKYNSELGGIVRLHAETPLVPQFDVALLSEKEPEDEFEEWENDQFQDIPPSRNNTAINFVDHLKGKGIAGDYEININIKTTNLVVVSDSNEPVVQVVQEYKRALVRHMVRVQGWLKVLEENSEYYKKALILHEQGNALVTKMEMFNV